MNFLPYGDQAILVNFDQEIDVTIHERVSSFEKAIQAANLKGINFVIPAYCSLTIGYDVTIWQFSSLVDALKECINSEEVAKNNHTRRLRIPVCYELALDWEEVQTQTQLSKKEVIHLHTSTTFRVFMLGFLPGFPYLGKLDKALFCSRKQSPRKQVPARSVAIAGFQTGIYPVEAPGGWQIIGRTPIPLLQTAKQEPFLFQVGDQVRFYPIVEGQYYDLEQAIQADHFNWEQIYA